MSKVIKWSLFLLLATALATLALNDNGQVAMVWGDWVLETSLTFAFALILIGFGAIYGLVRLVINVWHFPRYWRNRRQMKRYNKAENALAKGMIALEYGDWQVAEKQLIKTAKQSEAGLIHYLSAAKMAQNQGATERRNQYLSEARKRFPSDYVVIGLVESRLLADDQPQMAQVILAELIEQNPKNKALMAEYAHLLVKQQAWTVLESVLPQVRKIHALDKVEIQRLETRLIAAKVAKAADSNALADLWQTLSARTQLHPDVLAEFVEQKMGWGEEQGLADLIVRSLSKTWSDRLVYQYGRIELGPAFDRFKRAEKWLKIHPENAVLLLTLGRLACMSQFWGAARGYFQQSLALQPEVETFHALAQCYEAEGLDSQAAVTYKEAVLKLEASRSSEKSDAAQESSSAV